MKRIFDSADEFIRQSDWKDLAIIKFCLFSIGLLVGLQITEKCKKGVRIAAPGLGPCPHSGPSRRAPEPRPAGKRFVFPWQTPPLPKAMRAGRGIYVLRLFRGQSL